MLRTTSQPGWVAAPKSAWEVGSKRGIVISTTKAYY